LKHEAPWLRIPVKESTKKQNNFPVKLYFVSFLQIFGSDKENAIDDTNATFEKQRKKFFYQKSILITQDTKSFCLKILQLFVSLDFLKCFSFETSKIITWNAVILHSQTRL
jgi:hypothetical protein